MAERVPLLTEAMRALGQFKLAASVARYDSCPWSDSLLKLVASKKHVLRRHIRILHHRAERCDFVALCAMLLGPRATHRWQVMGVTVVQNRPLMQLLLHQSLLATLTCSQDVAHAHTMTVLIRD